MSQLTDLNAKIKRTRRETRQMTIALGYKAVYSRGICFIAMKDDNRAAAFDPQADRPVWIFTGKVARGMLRHGR